ncbi:hypothetical protein [Kineococcus rhizosphaerae]|uniref:Uncharacterized protein n=1 Tax=Kineococcus rhizosphaerae TaxID=559628 RepID=A0A2T0QXW6_9ACTN|nr:hypothetical protein [Kineococcus rhizosphaerae]PRY10869.1 hypothetical protein CLV37_115133 [Kineococcus rhizosphaerae]
MLLEVDRDSVAMGDDVVPHRRSVQVADDLSVAELLRVVTPDIAVPDTWTWVCHWNGVPFAVHSSGRGGRVWDGRYRTVADLPRREVTPELFFAYWTQVDSDWLLEQLRGGEPLDRRALERRWAPVAAERRERELRDRERTVATRLLDGATVEALGRFGAVVDLHTDTFCRFHVGQGRWVVRRIDSMTLVDDPLGRRGSLRPVAVARLWLVAALARDAEGYEAFTTPVVDSAVRASPGLWTITRTVGDRQELAQQHRPEDVAWFRAVLGRTVPEVVAAYRPDPAPPSPRRRWWRHRR